VKNKIIYVFLFLVAFVFTTGAVVFLNSIYANIFHFDFGQVTASDTTNVKDFANTMNVSFAGNNSDSLKALNQNKYQDSLQVINSQDSSSADTLKHLQNVIKPTEIRTSSNKSQDDSQFPIENTKIQADSSYIVWMKQTAKLYESMDSKKAAKIIQSYSDNIARDIIYSMKQKKAAEILSELNPITANRITMAKSNAF
jgi:flagellar motility protein MotE (MotC chaperone)